MSPTVAHEIDLMFKVIAIIMLVIAGLKLFEAYTWWREDHPRKDRKR